MTRLGHVYEGQPKIPGLDARIKRPDFIFFPDEETRQQAAAQQMSQTYTQHALAVGEVKAWDVPLGKKQKGAPSFDNNNPSYQIDYYLRAAELDWGILSNGRLWRLVHKDTSYKLDVYFEIDLAQAIESQNMAAIAFFACFFEQRAFRPDAGGRPFLADALQASADYALKLEADLRDNAYKALEHLIQGFIEPQANGLSADDLPAIYTNSLYLLYRIIFLFYGEARGLLPIENKAYQGYSITQFARTIAKDLDAGQVAPPMTNQSWARLQQLFTIIAGTQPDLNAYLGVPRYNGGLFNPELHPFLENHFVGDRYLHAAIDAIARREVGEKKAELRRENVDYRTLGVRQLGSIYEGLLEYQPRRATEPMVAVKRKKGEQWIAAAEAKKRAKILDRRDVGAVFLVTDKGERKATGSYYTPDYIVKYIVEQTLGPLVEQARERVKAAGAEGDEAGERFAREILALNVLDPAMGSGHFLVEATDYLARAIATDAYTTVDEAAAPDDDDLVYWRRQVVEACIYGVDKNRMAVELAKLSLWLVTVAKDRPLSFLDHHLRHGDSLVGARLADLAALPSGKRGQTAPDPDQPALLNESALTQDTFRAVGGMMAIETLLSDSIDDLHTKERVLADVRAHLGRWRRIADLWTSSFFGNEMTAAEYRDLLRYLQSAEADGAGMMSAEQRARFLEHPAVVDNDYFHWELEFPEVFFDQFGRALGDAAGFDAVVGNPPYANAWSMTTLDEQARNAILKLASDPTLLAGHWDLYVAFISRSLGVMKSGGFHAFIVPDALTREKYAQQLREHLLANTCIWTIMHFEGVNVFDEVSRHCVIYVLELNRPTKDHVTRVVHPLQEADSSIPSGGIPQREWLAAEASQIRVELADPVARSIIAKMVESSVLLGQYCYVMVGATTHAKSGAFRKHDVVTSIPTGNAKRFIDGKDLARYSIDWSGRYLDYRFDKMYGPRVPELFENDKIVVRDVTGPNETLLVALDEDGYYCDHTVTCATYYENVEGANVQTSFEGYERIHKPYPGLGYTTALLASRLLTWYFKTVFATGTLQGTYSHTYPQQVRALPIRRVGLSDDLILDNEIFRMSGRLARERSDELGGDLLLLQGQADSVHDTLSSLARGLQRLHKATHSLTHSFRLDVEGVINNRLFGMLFGSGKWEQSLAKAGVSPRFVDPESRRTRTLDESLGWDEASFKIFVKLLAGKVPSLADLVKVYRKHAPRYQELTRRIEETDRLIDQIVYQLYGLTDEEIAIVEAATG